MQVGEAIKKLLDSGFTELNQKGSHRKFGRGKDRITLVYHSSPKESVHPKTKKLLEKLLNESGN